jgi:xylulokinase
MESPIVLGLDIGTTNVKAVGFRGDGSIAAAASIGYRTYYPQEGWAEQDPADWQAAILHTLGKVVADLGAATAEVAGLGLSAHAPGMVPVDVRGKPVLERIPIWQDERAFLQGRQLLEEIGPEWVGLGMPFAAFAAKLKYFTETYPELAHKTQYALGVKSYLTGWLTGTYATDPSSEPGASAEWARVCAACGWSLEKLAPIKPATGVLGVLRQDLAQKIGLERSIPVVLGLNDGASATLGNRALHAGEGVITLGTNGVIFLVADGPIPPELRLQRALFCWPYLQDRWIIGGQSKAGAGCLQWLSEVMANSTESSMDLGSFVLESGTTPGSEGVMFYPYLMGRGTPFDDPSARAGFVGLTFHTRRSHIIRSVLEGVAFSLREILDTFHDCGLKTKHFAITGGGARSEAWRQIVANIFNQQIVFAEGDSCLGAAILASVGVGIFVDVDQAVEAMKQPTTMVQPQADSVQAYKRIYSEYLRTRDRMYPPS